MDLETLIESLRDNRSLVVAGEEATRQGAILPILARLGWDRDDIRQVVPEYSVGNGRVDYCLRVGQQSKVFIEVKRVNEDLDRHQEQLLDYAFRDGVEVAILTNGLVWWFYLPLFQGGWTQRKFLAVDFESVEPNKASDHLVTFLSFEHISNGKALASAKRLHESKTKEKLISETIPRAWQELCEQPEELLLELFAEKIESLCGHRPEEEPLAQYLLTTLQGNSLPPERVTRAPVGTPSTSSQPVRSATPSNYQRRGYTGKRLISYTFRGEVVPVRTFKDVLMGVCETLARSEPEKFARVLDLRGRKRPYFTRTPGELRAPQEIANCGIYVETNLSANNIMDLNANVLEVLGFTQEDFDVEVQ